MCEGTEMVPIPLRALEVNMSRSRKHTPVHGFTLAESEKEWKRRYNRLFRRKNNVKSHLFEDSTYAILKEVSDPWEGPKDGKFYKEGLVKYMRK